MSNPLVGVAAGAGAALIGKVVLPVVGSGLKFVTKSAIKGGLLAYAGGAALVDQTTHSIENIVSEARAEVNVGHRPAAKTSESKSRRPKSHRSKKATPSE